MEFRHPEKWRDTCDVFALGYHGFRPTEILGYPHAGNDVFHVKGDYRGGTVTAYVKAERRGGGLPAREAAVLGKLDFPCIPQVLDAGDTPVSFLVTGELPGRRLSVLLGDNGGGALLSYMEEYGETLARLHWLTPDVGPAPERRFMHTPEAETLEKLGLSHLRSFFEKRPGEGERVFCHGDFHYANLLWDDHRISGILDFELAGWGDRDFDIAWALILRPGQTFMRTRAERLRFLEGYQKYGSVDTDRVAYFMAQIYTYFLSFSQDDPDYVGFVRARLADGCAKLWGE